MDEKVKEQILAIRDTGLTNMFDVNMVQRLASGGIVACGDKNPGEREYGSVGGIIDNPVSHPSHYTDGKIEVIDFIEDKGLNYHRGNAVKYISRAGKKDPAKEIEDLQKAAWYINRDIQRLQEAQHGNN